MTYYLSKYDLENQEFYLNILEIELLNLLKNIKSYNYKIIGCGGSLVDVLFIIDSLKNRKDYINIKSQIFQFIEFKIEKYSSKKIKYKNYIKYDLISGYTNLGIYLLSIKEDDYFYIQSKNLLLFIEKQVLNLFDIEKNNYEFFSGYMLHINDLTYGTTKKIIDFGVSHGVIAPIYFLSEMYRIKKSLELYNVIIRAIDIYYKNINIIEGIPQFPTSLLICENQCKFIQKTRMSWCYGNIGVFKVLIDINNNLSLSNEQNYKYLKIIFDLDINDAELICPTFCHGLSGMLKILSSVGDKIYCTNDLNNKISNIIELIWSKYSIDYKFGFLKIEKYNYLKQEVQYKKIDDNISVIDGVSSIVISYINVVRSINDDFWSKMLIVK